MLCGKPNKRIIKTSYNSTSNIFPSPVNVSADANVAMLVAVGAHVPCGDGIGGSSGGAGAGAGACCRERRQRRGSGRSNDRSGRRTTSEESTRRHRGAVGERAEEGGGHGRSPKKNKNELVLRSWGENGQWTDANK